MSFHATDLTPRHQQHLCWEHSSTIGTDELGSGVSKISHEEEEDIMSGSTGGRAGRGDTYSSSHAWDAYPPEIDEGSKDFDQTGETSSESFSREQRMEQGDEVEDIDRFLYSDEYLQHIADDFGDSARSHPQSPQMDEFADYYGEVDDFYYGAGGTIDGGNGRMEGKFLWSPEQAVPNMAMTCPDRSDDLIHERYLEDRESIVGYGSGGDFGWESTDEEAVEYPSSSPSSGWSSFNVAEISYRDQEKQQQQQGRLRDDDEDAGGGGGVPELQQDTDTDDVFVAKTTTVAELFSALQQDDIIFDAPQILYESTTQSCPTSGDQTNTAYNPTARVTRMLPISHSSSSHPTPPPQQPQRRQRSETPASATKPTLIPCTSSKTTEYMSTTERPRDWILERLEGLASQFLYHLSMEERPVIELACRNRMDSVVYDQEVGIIRRRRMRVDDEVVVEVLSGQGDDVGVVGSLLEEAVVAAEMTERAEEEDKESGVELMETTRSGKRQRVMAGSGLKGRRRKKVDGRTNSETMTSDSGDTLNATTSPRFPVPLPPILPPSSPFTKRSVYGSKRTRRILRATELIHENVSKDTISSKRDMYYRDVLAFGSQRAVDGIVEDLACTFEVPRANLNVVAGTRSMVFGSVRMLVKALGGKHKRMSGGEKMENEKGEEQLPWLQEEIANSPFSKTQTLSHKQSHGYQHSQVEGDKRKEAAKSDEDPLDSRFSQTSYNTLVPIPVQFSDIVEIEIHPRTRFILVIEKEATFINLISLGFCETQSPGQGQGQGPCILLTSKGFPDQVARQLVKALEEMVKDGVYMRKFSVPPPSSGSGDNGCSSGSSISESSSFEFVSLHQSPSPMHIPRSPLDIPILALVDCDPHGIEIYLTYRCGSIQCAYENVNLAVPVLKCLGQIPSDWDLFFNPPPPTTRTTSNEPSSLLQESAEENHQGQEQLRSRFSEAFIPLTDKDRKSLERLMTTHPYIRQHARWREQIEMMLEVDAKTEIQSLHQLGLSCSSSGSGAAVVVGGSEGKGGGSGGAEGEERVGGAGGLVVYLQHKLQNPQSWL
ncbi:endodeoxyribonuclease [Linnemannia gamsii]|uniref:DNA topoisomerase (ATP-hydrolyzing) n=1 Tax=Linnemannia gamsii TaxID=64522 RepID=A0ABQ7JUH0_9FUNG|nr:endodeoxyribonuclease [Linnemannia gamsii]